MKIDYDKGNRTWKFSEIPRIHPNDPAELEIYANYTGEGDMRKGCLFDSLILPRLQAAFSLETDLRNMLNAAKDCPFFMNSQTGQAAFIASQKTLLEMESR